MRKADTPSSKRAICTMNNALHNGHCSYDVKGVREDYKYLSLAHKLGEIEEREKSKRGEKKSRTR